MRNPFRSQKTSVSASISMDTDVERLKEKLGEDLGLESGYHGFPPDKVAALAMAEVRHLAERRFGPLTAQAAQSVEQDMELQKELQTVEERRLAYRNRYSARPERREVELKPASVRWRESLVSVASIFALVGLAIDTGIARLGWRGWLALGLLATLLATNMPTLVAVSRRLVDLPHWLIYGWARYQDYRDYRRLGARHDELVTRIERLKQQREEEAARLRHIEEWIARTSELIMSHYGYYLTKGSAAAQLAR